MGHFREGHLHGIAGLRHAKAAECAGRRVIGIVRPTGNLKILVVIRPGGMGTCPLQHGAAQGRICPGICGDLCLDSLNQTVVIAAHSDGHLHGVALGMDEDALLPAELHLYRPTG